MEVLCSIHQIPPRQEHLKGDREILDARRNKKIGGEAYAGNSRFEQPEVVRALSAVTRVIPQETALHGVSGQEWGLEGVGSGANQAVDGQGRRANL